MNVRRSLNQFKISRIQTILILKIQKTRSNLDQILIPKIKNYEKTNKNGGKKKEVNLADIFFFFFFNVDSYGK